MTKEQSTQNNITNSSENLLLIFTRNPELGKCKTRLAATVGDENALEIYKYLLQHTANFTNTVNATKQVWYSNEIWKNDIWNTTKYIKKLQQGNDLGQRMAHAFKEGFANGFKRIIIIGSDMYDLSTKNIDQAFTELKNNDYVIGPAEDGGYYLLGMTHYNEALFQNKKWGSATVLKDTLHTIKQHKIALLETKNDIDFYEDIKNITAFQPYIQNI